MARPRFGSSRSSLRLGLESLEDRTCLSTLTLTAVHSGFWDDAGAHVWHVLPKDRIRRFEESQAGRVANV